jgi:tryptophanyl-tRNA synthetase
MIAALRPIRERALELQEQSERVDEILADGASKARRMAAETISEVRDRMGLLAPAPALSGRAQRELDT